MSICLYHKSTAIPHLFSYQPHFPYNAELHMIAYYKPKNSPHGPQARIINLQQELSAGVP